MLIRGDKLNERQRCVVLAAFGYRWTVENQKRATMWMGKLGTPRIAPVSDAQWINDHAFYFVKDGSRMMASRHHAEPAYLADDPSQALMNRTGVSMPS